MRGKNGTTSFLPKKKKGGKVRFCEEVTHIPNREKMCLTKDQATQIYEEVEKDEPINIQIVSQDIKGESIIRKRQTKKENVDMSVNPYQKAISNVDCRDDNKIEQMINWLIFSDKIRYIDSYTSETPRLTIRPLEEKKQKAI